MEDESKPINLLTETRTVEYVRFLSEQSLQITFDDGFVMQVVAQSPLACVQAAEGNEFDPDFVFAKEML